MNRTEGFKVPPLSRQKIRHHADAVRMYLGITDGRLDIVKVLEHDLHEQGICFDICEGMGDVEAMAYPDSSVIQVNENVYEDLVNEDGRARFTVAHEIGHLVMHHNICLNRGISAAEIKPYENSEWQADTFASFLLMPTNIVSAIFNAVSSQEAIIHEIMEQCGVTRQAAEVRKDVFRRHKI